MEQMDGELMTNTKDSQAYFKLVTTKILARQRNQILATSSLIQIIGIMFLVFINIFWLKTKQLITYW